jgi:FixJ family two-component response regulator
LRDLRPGPAEEAAFHLDYADWLATLSDKQRTVAEDLASGLNMSEVAARRGVSHAAVQDMRKTLARKWEEHEGGDKER